VPIWVGFMGKVLGDSPKDDFPMPDRVVLVPVDLDPSNECVRVVMMAFVKGTEPAVACGTRRQGVPGAPAEAPVPLPPPALPSKPQAAEPTPAVALQPEFPEPPPARVGVLGVQGP
jgi:membrane carboxypeptidase/penicillin-binding protein